MKTPRERAALTTSFIRPAISATRAVELGHQCLSHMSQMMIAVCSGCHAVGVVTVCQRLASGATSTRFRRFSVSGFESAPQAVVENSAIPQQVSQPAKTRKLQRMATSEIQEHGASKQFDGMPAELPASPKLQARCECGRPRILVLSTGFTSCHRLRLLCGARVCYTVAYVCRSSQHFL